ncbi:MAG TPA: S41 family peptidase [Steroidobacteraceae bacterium]|nr:S41 family peptidase [Steroidobacteraceae bacterium]
MALRARSGGYDLLGIESGGKLWIVFDARARSRASRIVGKLVLDSTNPEIVYALWLIPATPNTRPFVLNAAERHRVVERAAKLLDEFYVFPDVGKKMAATLRGAEARGAYRDITDGQVFALRLHDDLQGITHDEHLGVHFSLQVLPSAESGRSPESKAADRQRVLSGNCGFEKVEHLAPNIGYLKFDEFDDAGTCAPTAAAAMSFVANTDALIIDMRDNHGGRGQGVIDYLFAKPTHFMDTYMRRDHAIHEAWTSPHVPGKKFLGKPVFVLTSQRTFSNAESFCYALKTLGRATLVGESTGGGAHPMELHRIDDHFSISVPVGQSISPITHTDWEGTGVEPDIKVPADDALDEALKRARDLLQKHPPLDSRVNL